MYSKLQSYKINHVLVEWIVDFFISYEIESKSKWGLFRIAECYEWNSTGKCVGPTFISNSDESYMYSFVIS